jgi:ribulose-phosphate 3-epimerase
MAKDDSIDSRLLTQLSFLLYRYRFLLVYVVIGFSSILVEILLFRALNHLGLSDLQAKISGVLAGFGWAYFLNVRFNFKVPHGKRRRAFLFFVAISTGSFLLNVSVRSQFARLGWSYEQSRVATSGMLFLLAYYLHRRVTFVDAKQVGVAVYVNKVEDIKSIRQKVGLFPDFIHVDLVDSTIRQEVEAPNTHRVEVVHAYWPKKQLHVHLMTRQPSKYLAEVLPFADVVIVQCEIDENLDDVLRRIKTAGKRTAVCLTMDTPIEKIRPYAGRIDMLMLLAISHPGFSGQELQLPVLDRIAEVQHWPERKHFELCVDGGVNEKNIRLLNVEKVVSGSSVLNHPRPTRQIMRLQTSSNYEAI